MAAPASLVPHFGALFQGIRGLGASAGVITSALKAGGIGPGHRVIDLGCGKGATALALARALRCHTTGIEACAAFLDSAQRSLRGREGLVAFKHGDAYASSAPWARRTYDAVIMLNMGPAARCAERAWPLTRPGGLIVIDDCFEVTPGSGLASPSRDRFRRLLTRSGGIIVREIVPTPSSVGSAHASLLRRLEANAASLGKACPKLRGDLTRFIQAHRRAGRLLGRHLRPAIWIIRRPPA